MNKPGSAYANRQRALILRRGDYLLHNEQAGKRLSHFRFCVLHLEQACTIPEGILFCDSYSAVGVRMRVRICYIQVLRV